MQLTASIDSSWKSNGIDAASLNTFEDEYPRFQGQQTYNHDVKFVSPAGYNSLVTRFGNVFTSAAWNDFSASVNGVPMYDEPASYVPNPVLQGNDYLVQIGALCDASISLVEYVNNDPRALQTTAYVGPSNGQADFAPIASGNSPANRIFAVSLTKTCLTAVTNAGGYTNINRLGHQNQATVSEQYNVRVENPYVCNLPASNLQVTSPVAPNAQVSATFTLSNTQAQNSHPKAIRITSIELAQGSAFSNRQVNLPQNPIASGSSVQISLTATAPANAGNYPLNIIVTYATTDADCTGSAVQCSAPIQLSAQVVVQNQQQYSCTLTPANARIINNGAYPFTATCRNPQGGAVDCPILDWATNAGALSSARTQAQRAPSSTLTVNNPQGNYVRANGTVGAIAFSCDAALTPETISCALTPRSARISLNDRVLFNSSCTLSDGTPYSCPLLAWASNAGNMQPQQHNTSSTLTVTNERGNFARASGSFNGIPFSCQSILRPSGARMYCELSPTSQNIVRGNSYNFTASCYDLQNDDRGADCPQLSWSTNAGEMSPALSGAISTLTVTNESGTYVQADGASGGVPFMCNSTLTNFGIVRLPNLIARLTTDKLNPQRGESFTITAAVRNAGGDAGAFTNSLNLTGGIIDSRTFEAQSLAGSGTITQPFQFTCPNTPTIVNFILKADSGNVIAEPIERDNSAYLSVLCGPVLTCMDYV